MLEIDTKKCYKVMDILDSWKCIIECQCGTKIQHKISMYRIYLECPKCKEVVEIVFVQN